METFFKALHSALHPIKLESVPLVTLIGEKIAPMLVNSLIKDCLILSINSDKKDPNVYQALIDFGTNFHAFMTVEFH